MDEQTRQQSSDTQLTPAEKRTLAGRARTFQERLEAPAESDGTGAEDDPGSDDDVDAVLRDWVEYLDGRDRVRERLDHFGVSESECRRAVRADAWPADEPLPSWVDEVENLLAFVCSDSQTGRDEVGVDVATDDEPPFVEIVEALVAYARKQIDGLEGCDHLADSAVADLQERLEYRIVLHCSQPLFIEFKTYVAERDRELAFGDDPPVPDDPRRHYEAFTSTLLDGGLKSFLLEYSFLARLLVTIVDQWTAVVGEFRDRLTADYEALCETFNDGAELGPVTSVSKSGDRHAGGRATLTIEFESGVGAAYKPRSVDVSVAFFDVVSWIQDRSEGLDLRTVEYVQREEYGWMEWVEHRPCGDEAAVERYYRRTGRLIGLLYALRFYDGHLENVVANGEQPVLVDLETVGAPVPPHEEDDDHWAMQYRTGTVLQTDLLPEVGSETGPGDGGGGEGVPDLGGMNSPEVTWEGLQIPQFSNVNTDLMDLSFREEATTEENNLPTVDGRVVEPDGYADAVIAGFESTYQFIEEHATELLAPGGPVDALADEEARYLAAPTYWYDKLLMSLQIPRYLRTGVDFGCRTELLARRLFEDDDTATRNIYEAERETLSRLDIPRFTARIDSRDLQQDGSVVDSGYFSLSAREGIHRRIDGFGSDDLARQRTYLELAFRGRITYDTGTTVADPPDPGSADWTARARGVFDRLRAESVETDAGERSWLLQTAERDGFIAELVPDGLYDGRTGIALFAAALFSSTGDEACRTLADEAVGPVVESVRNDDLAVAEATGMSEWGGIVYGLTKLGELLDDARYTETAIELARATPLDRFEADEYHDVLHGNAGAILALCSLYEATDDAEIRDRATVAGDHLLSARVERSGVRIWETTNASVPLQGFAHGVGGVAHALGRLADCTGDQRFADAAVESLAFEHDLYDESRANWRDLRGEGDAFSRTWCHGQTGIGLSRLGLLETVGGEAVEAGVERALASPDAETLQDVDHLCCGNFGRVDWLVEAGQRLDEPAYRDQARRLAAAAVARAEKNGFFRSPAMNEHLYNPGLLMGEPGIGYAMARLADPSLPCLLVFE